MSLSEALPKIRSLTKKVADKSLPEKERVRVLIESIDEGNRITEIEYAGYAIRCHPDFLEQKKLANQLFNDLKYIYEGTLESVFDKYLEDTDEDYVVTLWQTTWVASLYNQQSSRLDDYMKVWFILGFYAFVYELACKPLSSLAKNLFVTGSLSCGDVRSLFKEKLNGKYSQIGDCFDNFLRNAINHSQYIFNDESGSIYAWNVDDGKKTPKQNYKIEEIFNKTVKLLFLIVSLFIVFNEELKKKLVEQYGQ